MENAMDLTKKHFDEIAEFVQENLPAWSKKLELVANDSKFQKQSFTLETELRHQRELMKEGFKQMDIRFKESLDAFNKRFEQVDKRFEQVDKRFEQVDKRFEESRENFREMFNFMKWQTGLSFIMVTGIYIKLFFG